MFKNQKGFTLVEMLVVLLIISVLILITVPNVTKHFKTVDDKGCEAYIKMVQGQVEAYKIAQLQYPTSFQDLIDSGYLPGVKSGDIAGSEGTPEDAVGKCPDGQQLKIQTDGTVTVASNQS